MLLDEGAAVDGHYLASREGFRQHAGSFVILGRLRIRRQEHGLIHDEEIGIRGRKPLAVTDDRVGKGQGE